MIATRRLNTTVGVAENRFLTGRYAYVEDLLAAACAALVWSEAALEVKNELGLIAYESACTAAAWHARHDELFPPTAEAERPLALDDLVVDRATVADIGAAKAELARTYASHLTATDEVTDAPTARILERARAEADRHAAWARTITGGVDTTSLDVRGTGAPVRRPARHPAVAASDPGRDARWRIVAPDEYRGVGMGESPEEIVRHLLYTNTYGEMEAAEILGAVLATADALPRAMRLDLYRQLWDECRHAEMSWRRMEEIGGPPDPLPMAPPFLHTTMTGVVDPLERLLVLQRVIEGRVTERHRYRVVYVAEELGDPVTARLYEYIVADERTHIGFSDWVHRLVDGDEARIARLDELHETCERVFEDLLARRADPTTGMRTAS